MSKVAEIKKEIQEYKDLIADGSVPQDEKDFAKGEIEDLEKQLADLEKKDEPKKKEEPKTEKKAEKKGAKKTASKKPKRTADEKDEADCEELEEREEKAKDSGYDIDALLTQAKERKAKAKARAEERKNEPKKTPSTKNKEAVEKTTTRVTENVQKRVEKGEVNAIEVEKLIAEYEEAIIKLRKILAKIKAEKKMGKGGGVKAKRTEDEIERDKNFSAEKGGNRTSHKYAKVRMKDGTSYSRRNSNQFGKVKGGKHYVENRPNHADKNKFL